MEAADVVLMRDDISLVLKVLDISQAIKTKIKQNIAWAIIYNLLTIPISCGALYPFSIIIPPAVAGLNELLSSLPVILNSLLIRRNFN